MNEYIKTDPWRIVEDKFRPERVKASESLFSIGNGAMGGRANFEEAYSGPSLRGNYVGGVYYPDKTRVGWWKNGYPEYFAKVLNSAFWIGVGVKVNGVEVDLARHTPEEFYRELDMKRGVLTRRFTVTIDDGTRVAVEAVRFVSLARTELGVVSYTVRVLNRDARVELTPYIDADVRNEDANYNENFWEPVSHNHHSVTMRTRKTGFEVCWHAVNRLSRQGTGLEYVGTPLCVAERVSLDLAAGEDVTLYKYVAVCSSLNHTPDKLAAAAAGVAKSAAEAGFAELLREHEAAWAKRWNTADIVIEGDDEAQQGIRYCVFMLLQTYTGLDSRLNIGPKGFTGEKYGGSTYWDTEAYCIPFYLATQGQDVARQLLVYRHNQLDRAIENAAKLGFTGGAALYPMVTMNGEESHNEWEITFEEIHRNGSIAFAIYNYIRYTGDKGYLASHGLEVLIGIARFWAQRATFSAERSKWVILGVTGPNEYENNVNNNWFTNYIARWCMEYALEAADWVRTNAPADWARIVAKREFDIEAESAKWRPIIDGMYLPEHRELGIFLQQDGYMDKEQTLVSELDPSERPLNQKWSWDRILRSPFIKQADVLQGIYYFQERFDEATIERNFRFYEARTVHESSLSPCVHSILAAKIGDDDKAYEMYLRAARLDLDDYNRENEEGCHITSMAGSWLSVVEGFGGMRVRDGRVTFSPRLPAAWRSLSFRVIFRGSTLRVKIADGEVEIFDETTGKNETSKRELSNNSHI
jgi:maltose phosphorylase